MPDEIIATIGLEVPFGKIDGAGSGHGLAQCPSCARWIDTSCGQCETTPAPKAREEALSRREELRSQQRRERSWYERGRR